MPICERCKKEFIKNKVNQRFCSLDCQNKSNCNKWYHSNKNRSKKYSKEYQYKKNELRRIKYAEDKEYREKIKLKAIKYTRNNSQKRKLQRIFQNYHLTEKQYKDLLDSCNHKCCICGYDITDDINFFPVIDHCHNTNKVRGILCMNCNMGLGKFKDNIEYLENAIKYLKKYKE